MSVSQSIRIHIIYFSRSTTLEGGLLMRSMALDFYKEGRCINCNPNLDASLQEIVVKMKIL